MKALAALGIAIAAIALAPAASAQARVTTNAQKTVGAPATGSVTAIDAASESVTIRNPPPYWLTNPGLTALAPGARPLSQGLLAAGSGPLTRTEFA